MKYSIIVPVYNVEPYLEQCVSSILRQRHQDFEVVLVDDGSNDGSAELCDALRERDARVRVIHQANGGLSAARNAGIRISQGEIIMFLDSDDYWLTTDALLFVDSAFQDETLDFIEFGCVKFHDRNENLKNTQKILPLDIIHTSPETKEHLITKHLKKGHLTACAWNKAIRRDLIEREKLFFREGFIGEDIDWNARLLSCSANFAITDTQLVAYRKRENSITSSTTPDKLNQLISNLVFIRDHILVKSSFLRQYLAIHVANAYITASALAIKDYGPVVNNLSEFDFFLTERTTYKVRIVKLLVYSTGYYVTRLALRSIRFIYAKLMLFRTN